MLGCKWGRASRWLWALGGRWQDAACGETGWSQAARYRDVLGSDSGGMSTVVLQICLFPWLWSPDATDSGALAL